MQISVHDHNRDAKKRDDRFNECAAEVHSPKQNKVTAAKSAGKS
jgi:hypothetical protein